MLVREILSLEIINKQKIKAAIFEDGCFGLD